jgi:hypothetical protein
MKTVILSTSVQYAKPGPCLGSEARRLELTQSDNVDFPYEVSVIITKTAGSLEGTTTPLSKHLHRSDALEAFNTGLEHYTSHHYVEFDEFIEPMKKGKQIIIDGLDRFIPLSCGDDPSLWNQKDTVERIKKYLEQVLPDDVSKQSPKANFADIEGALNNLIIKWNK